MASLNTLRTRFGVVLSVVIGLALLAFVLSLKTEMGFSGNDPKVGVIDGNKIKYSDYIEEYDRVKARHAGSESDPQQADMLADAAWQELFSKNVLVPGFEKMGIVVGEQERLAMLGGEQPSTVYAQIFTDPRTGAYDVEAVTRFLEQAEGNVQALAAWNDINSQAMLERAVDKYLALLRSGVYANKLEAEQGLKAANETCTGKLARRKYDSVADSLVEVKEAEIRAYYNAHKEEFRQVPSRAITYVVFDVDATDDDMLALEKTAMAAGEEFAAAEDVRAFVRSNRNGSLADSYVSAAQLTADEAEALMNGRMYGPVLKNNIWTMSRVESARMAPDTLGVRHIVLPYTQDELADSLLTALRAGADFAEAARTYSVYDASAARGGEVGELPFSSFPDEFAEALAGASNGDIVKVASGDAVQLIQVYRADKPTKHVRVASVNYPVEASAETRRNQHNAAGTFSVKAKGSVEAFTEAASAAAVTPRAATLRQGERSLRGLEDSRELVRWAYNAKPGDVSEIFNVDGDYVIAVVTGIDDDEYASLDAVTPRLRNKLLRDKKYDYIVRDAAGTTFADLTASIATREGGNFENLSPSALFIDGVGVEPRLIGAIAAAKQGEAGLVKGSNGVYVFSVDRVTDSGEQTADAERVRRQSMMEYMLPQQSMMALQQMAEVEDLRGRYF